jgi:transcriptional regulator with XRE-family HTH domain
MVVKNKPSRQHSDTHNSGASGKAQGGELCLRLRVAREQAGLTQAQLADVAEVAINTVKQYESGRIRPGAEALAGYARAGVSLHYLLLGEGEPLRTVGAAPRLKIAEGAVAYGETPVVRIVEAMLSIADDIEDSESATGVRLTGAKRIAVAQALFEEFLESGTLPKPATVQRFVNAAR